MAARQPHNVFECLWQRLRSSAGAAMVESLTAVLLTATLCAAGVVPTVASNNTSSGENTLALVVMALDDELMPGVTSDAAQSGRSVEASGGAEDESEPAPVSQDSPSAPAAGDGQATTSQNTQSQQPQSAAAAEEQQTQRMLERTIVTADGIHFTIKLKYDEAAGIPEGAQLSVVQVQPEPEDLKWREDPAYKDRPLETERFVNKIDMTLRTTKLSECLKVEKDEYVFYTKFIDVAIVSNGSTIQPKAPVEITIETDAIDRALSDEIEIALDIESTSMQFDKTGFQQVQVENKTELPKDPEAETPEERDGRVKLAFTTDRVANIGLAGVVQPLTSRQVGASEITVLGPRGMAVWTNDMWIDVPEEELLDSFYFDNSPYRDFGTTFWLKAPALGNAAAYRVAGVDVQEQLIGTAGATAPVPISDKDGVAVLQEAAPVPESSELSAVQESDDIDASALVLSVATAKVGNALQVASVGGASDGLRASAWDDLSVQATMTTRVVTKVYAESRADAVLIEGSERYISLDSILISVYNVLDFRSGGFGYTYAQSFTDMYKYLNGEEGRYFDCAIYEKDNRLIGRIDYLLWTWRYYEPDSYIFNYGFSGEVGVTYYVCDPGYTTKSIKLTDGNGNVLYLSTGKPALFDNLDDAFAALGNCYTTSAHNSRYTGSAYKVMMLKSAYTQNSPITHATGNYQVTLTTEGKKPVDGKYRGPGGACTITKGYGVGTNSLIPESFNRFELNNITLDGANIQGESGALVRMTATGKTLVIGENATLTQSSSSGSGGAVYISDNSTATIGAAQFSNNTSSANGGAIAAGSNVTLTATGATFNACTATNLGGAVYLYYDSVNPTFTNCTIANCSVGESGGGIFTWSGSPVLDNCTMTGNQASRAGGCICYANIGGSLVLKNCTMTGNSSGTGSVVWLCDSGTLTVDGGTISNNYSVSGAIYPNSSSSTLYFMNNAYVYDNHQWNWSSAQCNVYLQEDSNGLIRTNSTGLGANAKVGIWVTDERFDVHGGVNDPFGTYASTANLNGFVNDRNNLKASANTEEGLIVWVQPIKVEVRYVSNLDFTSVPTSYSILYRDDAYYFTQSDSIEIDEIAAELRQHCVGGTSTMQFWRGYAYDPTGVVRLTDGYMDDLQRISSYGVSYDPNIPSGTWKLASRWNNSPAHNVAGNTDNTLVVYFTDYTYFTIRNSTGYPMNYYNSGYFGSSTSQQYGASMTEVAKVVTPEGLVDFEPSMLNLQPYTELTMQILGGAGDYYYFSGDFSSNSSRPINVTENGIFKMILELGGNPPNVGNFEVSGNLNNATGGTTVLVFDDGDAGLHKVIIRKVDGDTNRSLSGASFTLMSASKVTIAENLSSGPSGVFFIGELHNGTYYLVEDVSPSGYAPAGYESGVRVYYEVTVNGEGTSVSEPRTGDVSSWGGGASGGGASGGGSGGSGGDSGGDTPIPDERLGIPVVGQGCTAAQSEITAANWGPNSFTWRQGNGYVYGEGSDGSVPVVFANGTYYLPYIHYDWADEASLGRVSSILFFAEQGFNVSHLTDGANHRYGTQWYYETVSWAAYSG